jgi:hypothetical protein
MTVLAEWIDDGFLHPTSQVKDEFTDVDDFLHVPVEGLADIVQFFRVRVHDGDDLHEVVIVGHAGLAFRELLTSTLRARHAGAEVVFIRHAKHGDVTLADGNVSRRGAVAVAVTNYRCAWDESAEIRVTSNADAISVLVAFDSTSDRYIVSTKAT